MTIHDESVGTNEVLDLAQDLQHTDCSEHIVKNRINFIITAWDEGAPLILRYLSPLLLPV